MRPVAAVDSLIRATLQCMANEHKLDVSIWYDALGDQLQIKYYLLFKRRDAEGQTLTVPVDDCADAIEPLITAMKTGITLLGGPARG